MDKLREVYVKDIEQLTYEKPSEDAGHFYNGVDVDALIVKFGEEAQGANNQYTALANKATQLNQALTELIGERRHADYIRNVLALLSGCVLTLGATQIEGAQPIWFIASVAIAGVVLSLWAPSSGR